MVELAYLNRILSSSLTLNFDQQEVMLDLLGRQLLADDSTEDIDQTHQLLDDICVRIKRYWPLDWLIWTVISSLEVQTSILVKCPT